MILIKAFIKRQISSVETVLSAYNRTHIHTQAPAHTSILTIQNLYTTENGQRAAYRNLTRMKTAPRNGKSGRSVVLGKETC